MWLDEIDKKKSQVLYYKLSSVMVLVSAETLTKPGYVMRLHMYTVFHTDDEGLRVLIDPELYEGEYSHQVFILLSELGSLNKNLSLSILDRRPSWMFELQDLNIILNGKDGDRNSNLEAIEYLAFFASGYESSEIIQWVLQGAPEDTLDPPGWDRAAITYKILMQLIKEEEAKK